MFWCFICLCDTKVTGVVIDEAVLKGHCANLLRPVRDRNLTATAPVIFLSLFTFFASSEIIKSRPETCKKDSSSGELVAEVLCCCPRPHQNHSCCSDVWSKYLLWETCVWWKQAWKQLRVTDRSSRFLCLCITESNVLHQGKSTNPVWQKRLFCESVGLNKDESQCTLLEPWQLIPLFYKTLFMTVIYWTVTVEIFHDLLPAFQYYNDIFVPSIFMEYDVISDLQWCLYNPKEELLPENKTESLT